MCRGKSFANHQIQEVILELRTDRRSICIFCKRFLNTHCQLLDLNSERTVIFLAAAERNLNLSVCIFPLYIHEAFYILMCFNNLNPADK